jgi:hypothetical protein
MFSGKIAQNACKRIQIGFKLAQTVQTMFSSKITQNACKLTQIAFKLAQTVQSGFSGKMTQYACKVTQIPFKLAQIVQFDVFRQNDSICVQTDSNYVQTGTNRANRCFLAKKIKIACKLTQIAFQLVPTCKPMFSSNITQNACKLTQIALKQA